MGEIPKHAPDPLVGRTLGRATIDRKLASGGMGDVYFGYYGAQKQEVAIKVLAPELLSDKTNVARFKLEAESAQKIHHANVVRIIDSGAEGTNHYIVMEFVKGEPIDAMIRKEGKLDFDRATRYARDIAKALEAAHAQRVIHRDVKPANVIVDLDGHVKLTDFGIVREEGKSRGLTAPGLMVGTPEFMSPEQVSGAPVDHRTDLFSLGVTYFYFLTGKFPYDGETDVKMAIARVKFPPKAITAVDPHIDPRCVPVIEKLLKQNPKERYSTAKETAAALEKAMYGRGETTARQKEKRPRAQSIAPLGARPGLRHPGPRPVVAMGLVALSAILWLGASLIAKSVGPTGIWGSMAGSGFITAAVGVILARNRFRDGPGIAASVLALLAGPLMLVGAKTALGETTVPALLVSRTGLLAFSLSLLGLAVVDAFGKRDTRWPGWASFLAIAAAHILLFVAAAGPANLAAPFRLFSGSLETVVGPVVAVVLGLSLGSILLIGIDSSGGTRIAGLVLLGIGLLATGLWATAGAAGTPLIWGDFGRHAFAPARELLPRLLADGAFLPFGLGAAGLSISLLGKPPLE